MNASVKNFDGQWVATSNGLINGLSSATSVGTYSLDLSSILPNDNYNYLVKLRVYGYRSGSTPSASQRLFSSIFKMSVGSTLSEVSSNTRVHISIIDIPVGTDRKLTYEISENSFNEAYVFILGYRRLGTNT